MRNLSNLFFAFIFAVTVVQAQPMYPPGVNMRTTSGVNGNQALFLVYPTTYFGLSCGAVDSECTVSLNANVTLLGNAIGDVETEIAGGTSAPAGNCNPGRIYINRNTGLTGVSRYQRKWECIDTVGGGTWAQAGDVLSLGRSGGLDLAGGTDSGDDLTLRSTTHATRGQIFIDPNFAGVGSGAAATAGDAIAGTADLIRFGASWTSPTGNKYDAPFRINPTITYTASVNAFRGLWFDPHLIANGTTFVTAAGLHYAPLLESTTNNIGPPSFGAAILAYPTYKTTGVDPPALAAPGPMFSATPKYWVAGDATQTFTKVIGYHYKPTTLTDTGDADAACDNPAESEGCVTLTTTIGYTVENASLGAGAGYERLETQTGFNCDSLTTGNTANTCFYSAGATTDNRLVGPTRMGADAAPDTILHVSANASKRAAITMEEDSTTPANPTSGTQARIYVKADKLIVQFNDAGTTRYKYLDLTSTGVTWVHTTVAP